MTSVRESQADIEIGELKRRLEDWFTASENDRALFRYDERWGTLIGYPASYGSDGDLNDHHFHYGYFIKAAAKTSIGGVSSNAGMPSGSTSHGCLLFTQICARGASSRLWSSVPARTVAIPGRELLVFHSRP